MYRPAYVLPLIVTAQVAGTSLWFAGNAVLTGHMGLSAAALTASVQAGFITGTLVFALLSLADRLPASLLFLCCSLLGAAANAIIPFVLFHPGWVLGLRLATGFFLAGIYPVGMKIAADWYPEGIGKSLGWLVGALVLGTAFPHGARAWLATAEPAYLLGLISLIAAGGGLLLFLALPSHNAPARKFPFGLNYLKQIWRERKFRAAAYAYLGHMWELYTFWAFVPLLIAWFMGTGGYEGNTSLLAFSVVGAGAVGCVAGGYISDKCGSAAIARAALIMSGMCCLLSPLMLRLPPFFFILFQLLWGMAVAADSPQLSAIVAQTAPAHLRGTALTALTSAGFTLTVISLFFIQYLAESWARPSLVMMVLAPGPLLGAWAMAPLFKKPAS